MKTKEPLPEESEFFVAFRLIHSARRSRIALRIGRDGILEVLAPLCFSETEARKLIAQNAAVVEKLRLRTAQIRQTRPVLSADSRLLYLGESYPLFTSLRLSQFDGERFMVPDGEMGWRLDVLEKIYKKLAAGYIIPRTAELAEQFELTIGTVRINKAVTRWGSCSAKGDLNFSWHLIRAPEELVDSVICHELAHRLELNHSPRFYHRLSQMDPLYAEHKTALRRFAKQHPWFR